MGALHSGNVQPSLDLEEHTRISGIDGRKVFVFDDAGNQVISFGGGSGNATVALDTGTRSVGLVTLNPSSAYIGLVTNTQVGLVTLAPSPNFRALPT